MKALRFLFMALAAFCVNSYGICADNQAGAPISFVAGCEIDLDADGNPDSALLMSAGKGYELIVIMRMKSGTKSYVLDRSDAPRYLICNYGSQLKETSAGPGKKVGRTYTTKGTYLTLLLPESSEAAYFWSENEFKKVWLAD